jgi:abortive infection bacteriophage resistance protein
MTRVFSKPSLNLDQQIAHLRDNGMAIPDEERARYWLTHVSYYRLSAYWLYFERPKDKPGPRFNPGTDFETVTALYDFDRVLRRLVMRGTEHVEVALRGSWAYQLASLDHGHSYLDAGLYSERKQFHDCLIFAFAKKLGCVFVNNFLGLGVRTNFQQPIKQCINILNAGRNTYAFTRRLPSTFIGQKVLAKLNVRGITKIV